MKPPSVQFSQAKHCTENHYSMERQVCLRGQEIAREGKPCDKLIVIYEGEFAKYRQLSTQKMIKPSLDVAIIKRQDF